MSAAQLLRILQTSSGDVKYETCVFDTDEPKVIMKENRNGILCRYDSFGKEADTWIFTTRENFQFNNDREGATDPLASDMKDREHLPNSPKLECSSKAKDLIRTNEIESKSSDVSSVAASDLSETDPNVYTDKNIAECELSELVISCKEVNYHIVKDICIDEWIPKEETMAGGGVAGSCLENTEDVAVNECGMKEEEDGKSLVPVKPKFASKISFDKDTTGECDPKDSIQVGVTTVGAPGKVECDISEGSFVNNMLPVQEFGTRSFLRSFLNSLNSEEKEAAKPLDQIPSREANKKVQSGNLSYNSKMESESITFNFNSPKPAEACSMNESIETVNEQSIESEDNHLDASPVQCAIPKDSVGNVREQHLKDDNYDNSSSTCSRCNMGIENVKQFLDHDDRSDNQSLGQVLFTGRKDKSTRNAHDQALETINISKHGDGNLKAQWDDGEASFSAGDHVTYSGPTPFSGNLSVRSDSSAATSTRSFAFPVLQYEWNNSPVRMAKADRRHFRKHKDCRSGLLCCRF
ncbi:uncharacterized protein LOC111369320 isoform X2 [Olea europaea var. sylvestris]|uniref:uncharacterized protein LOC111369320 isoform X2 n=1 Tax=Olea europaea var. sylvestris TaxID=158386 RepID=UPI000C1D73B0|nr:uncharacterized protein LOC111369320 isoform X2 [Olea europaea var. sylvestris]